MASLVHAFVMSRVDYCNVVYAGAPKATTDKLQRVLNTADRVVTDTRKFGRGLKQMIHSELHWLDAPECINYISLVCYASLSGWNCFMVGLYRGTLPPPVSATASRHHLRSAAVRSVCCAVLPTEFIRTFGFHCRWPNDMELTTETLA